MLTKSPFKQLTSALSKTVCVTFNDTQLHVPAGSNLAAALLAAGVRRFRCTPESGAPRAPYCMMGVCFECLLEIDGVPNSQSCLATVCDGMKVRSQEGVRQALPESNDETSLTGSRKEF